MKSEGHSWMKLRLRYHSTHFMRVMIDLPSLRTPTPQHHKTPNPHNATTARTPREPHNNKTPTNPNTCMPYAAATAHPHQHRQTHIFIIGASTAVSMHVSRASSDEGCLGGGCTSWTSWNIISQPNLNIKAIQTIVGIVNQNK